MRVDQHPAPAEPSKRLGKTRASFRRARRLNALHLWAAVIGSLPALFLCLSGMLLVFEPELQGLEEREHIVVSPGEDLLPLRQLVSDLEAEARSPVEYVGLPEAADRVALLGTEDGLMHFVDPYRGDVLGSATAPAPLMGAVRVFHTSFFLGEFGTWIGIVSSGFLIVLTLSGCWLYLRRRMTLVRRFRVRWSPPRRRDYELHAVAGLVTAVPLLLIALSGALIGLGSAWRETILFVTASEWRAAPVLAEPVSRELWDFDLDEVLRTVEAAAPEGMFVESVSFPFQGDTPLRVRLLYDYATRPASWAFLDPRDGELLEFHHHWDYDLGHLIHRLNRGFHSGELYTLGMRWLWLFLMLTPVALAYTGYRQWRTKSGGAKPEREASVA